MLLLGLSVADTDGEDEPEDSPQPLSENSEGVANELLEATAMSRYSVFLFLNTSYTNDLFCTRLGDHFRVFLKIPYLAGLLLHNFVSFLS